MNARNESGPAAHRRQPSAFGRVLDGHLRQTGCEHPFISEPEFCEISNSVSQLSGLRDYALRIRRDFTKSGDWGAIEAGGKERIRLRPNSGWLHCGWHPVSQRRDVGQDRENRAHRTAALAVAMLAFVVIAILICHTHAVMRRVDIIRGFNNGGAIVGSKECRLF
ncbi:hypothetical protein [Ensifer adhaerens]|uniref:hypothetical protein n=1 Tax=Ensifer adhaerens TaxID=106592 RepID=UPI00128F7C40|nr:hypothetical protein [Ensifer adhaerens]